MLEFIKDIKTLDTKLSKGRVIGFQLPSSEETFYRAKQKEIMEQYAAARLFLCETQTPDWKHWIEEGNSDHDKVAKLTHKAYFYETSLFYYNIIVDLSWTLCYVTAEFSYEKNGERLEIDNFISIEDAGKILRNIEKNVSNPNCEKNAFEYLKKMCPEFTDSIDLIVSFWKTFSETPIRKKYNYCKHKGKFYYNEIEELQNNDLIEVKIIINDQKMNIPTRINEVQEKISIEDGIIELKKFDDECLFPYLLELFKKLESVIEPYGILF